MTHNADVFAVVAPQLEAELAEQLLAPDLSRAGQGHVEEDACGASSGAPRGSP